MKWKIRITGIAPASRLKVAAIAQVLGKIPGVDSSNLTRQLLNPPFDFLTASTEADAQKITTALSRLGLSNQIIEIKPEEIEPESTQSTADSTLSPTDSSHSRYAAANNHKQQSSSSMTGGKIELRTEPPITSGKIELRPETPTTGGKIELRPENSALGEKIELRGPRPVNSDSLSSWDYQNTAPAQPNYYKQIAGIAAIVLLGIAVWALQFYVKENHEVTTAPHAHGTVEKKEENPAENTTKSPKRNRRATPREQIKQRQQIAQQQQQYADQMLELALSTNDSEKSNQLLQTALDYNPYNVEAWKLLVSRYKSAGNIKAAEAAQKRLEHSERVKAVLASIAEQFGTSAQVEVNTASVNFSTQTGFNEPKEFYELGEKIYDTVSLEHPEKNFALEAASSASNAWRVEVTGGEDYPSYEEWVSGETSKNATDPEKLDR